MNWIYDTHSHLTYPDYPDPIEAVLDRSRAAGVTRWITVGTDTEHNRKAIDLAARFEGMYAVVGIHPHHASEASDDDLALLADQARENKVVAIGETGLDFHYNFSTKDRQVEVFRAELTLAAERGLPVVIHSRDAFAETIVILDEFAAPAAAPGLPLPRRPRRSDPGHPRPRVATPPSPASSPSKTAPSPDSPRQ